VNGQIGWTDLFWSASGRLARTPFLLASAALILLGAIYAQVPPTLQWLSGWLVYPALIWSGACVLSKRLHDRGRSGWWAALVLFAFAAEWTRPYGVSSVVFIAILIWAVIELGVMQGEDGANRFGPSPMAMAA
jgi:uncharacterized membrane protein YhaH (DUF805 family)